MNAIEQMMQASGANPGQAIAALFGPQRAAAGDDSAFAAVFDNLVQNFAADGSKEITSPEAIAALDELSPQQAEFLASLGVQIPATQEPAAFQGQLTSTPTTENSQKVNFQKVAPSSLININVANINVAPDSGKGIDLASISALPEGAKAELLQALKGIEQSGKIPALTLTAPDGEAHVLPVSELAALIGDPEATGGDASGQPAGATPTVAPASAAAPEQAATPATGPAPTAAQAPTSETLAASLVAGDAVTGDTTAPDTLTGAPADATTTATATNQAAAAQAGADAAQAADALTDAAATQAAAAKQAAAQQTAQAEQKADAQAQNSPDGYMVAANQPQQNATASQNNLANSGKKPANGTVTDKLTQDSSPTTPAAQSRAEALTARAVDPVMPRTETALPPNVARDPALTMTPERLAGMPDGAASEMVSTGLSGMRGDSSFMSSMSLLGGHASRGLQGHVAKQLNMSVSKAVKAGESEFTMRLDPAELGRVQVKLKFLEGGRVHAQVVAERPETLDLLQRDARGLERAIQTAGTKAQGATIEFSLDQGSSEESAGKAFAEAVQQEKMRDTLAARSAGGHALPFEDDGAEMEDVPLDDILPYVDAETGLDIRV